MHGIHTANFLDRNVLNVETNVVAGKTLSKLLVMHLNGLDFSGNTSGGEGNEHAGLDDTGLDTTDRNCPNTTNLVDILKGKTEGLVGSTVWGFNGINGVEKGFSIGLSSLGLLIPTLVPRAVGGIIDHVVTYQDIRSHKQYLARWGGGLTVEPRDRDERNRLRVETNLLDEVGGFLDDFLEAVLRPFGGIHLVDSHDELLYTQRVGKQSVLTGLTILRDTSLELTSL